VQHHPAASLECMGRGHNGPVYPYARLTQDDWLRVCLWCWSAHGAALSATCCPLTYHSPAYHSPGRRHASVHAALERARAALSASSCPTAIMPLSGVRISWLMRARNCDLASVAAAACPHREPLSATIAESPCLPVFMHKSSVPIRHR